MDALKFLNMKYELLTPNIERVLSLQHIPKFGLMAPYYCSPILSIGHIGDELRLVSVRVGSPLDCATRSLDAEREIVIRTARITGAGGASRARGRALALLLVLLGLVR